MNEKRIMICLAGVFGLVTIGVLVGGWLAGVELIPTFVGYATPHEISRGMLAVKGAVIMVTISSGGLLLASLAALATNR